MTLRDWYFFGSVILYRWERGVGGFLGGISWLSGGKEGDQSSQSIERRTVQKEGGIMGD